MPKRNPAKRPSSPRSSKTSEEQSDQLTRALNSGLALREAHRLLPPALTWGMHDHDPVIAEVTMAIGEQFLDLATAERWLDSLKVAVNAPAIPVDARDALLVMVDQIEHEFFRSWIHSAILTGVALGLKGYGRELLDGTNHPRYSLKDD